MINPTDVFCSLVRIAGASFPGSASLAQLQSEMDMAEFRARLERLEDPISALHPDVPDTAQILYRALEKLDGPTVHLEPEEYEQFARPLALLEAQGLIQSRGAIGSAHPRGIRLVDPVFILYAATLEGVEGLAPVNEVVDESERGKWLDGHVLAKEHEVPLDVVRAIFRIYEARGLGMMSKETGPHRPTRYLVKA